MFTVTVQDHGKYPDEPVLTDPAVTVTACPEEDRRCHGVPMSIASMRRTPSSAVWWRTWSSGRKDRLVLCGDHQPALGLESGDMTGDSLFYTEYILWSNFGLEQRQEDLTSYQLSSYVLHCLRITDGILGAFHQFSGRSRDTCPTCGASV